MASGGTTDGDLTPDGSARLTSLSERERKKRESAHQMLNFQHANFEKQEYGTDDSDDSDDIQ